MNIKEKLQGISKRTKIIISSVIGVIIIGVVVTVTVMPPSVNSVFKEAKSIDETLGSDEAISYIYKTYNVNSTTGKPEKGLFEKMRASRTLDVFILMRDEEIKKVNNLKLELENSLGMSIEDYNNIVIEEINIVDSGRNSKYCDIEVTISNKSSIDINYIKLDLFYKDKDGNIIDSNWTNDNSCIKAGAKKVITKMTEKEGWDSVSVEISEIHQ